MMSLPREACSALRGVIVDRKIVLAIGGDKLEAYPGCQRVLQLHTKVYGLKKGRLTLHGGLGRAGLEQRRLCVS
jgi:hypothetical protein